MQRHFSLLFWCLAVAGWWATATPLWAAPARPNVVIIIADDMGYGDLSCHGNPQVHTPHLDKLARQSIRFHRFFVSPLCAPTRASLLTGRYSLRTGTTGVSSGQETMRAEEVTLAEVFRQAGYRTGLFGKWHNGEHFPYTPQGQGFQTAFGFNLGHWNNYFDTVLKDNGRPVRTKGFITDVVTTAACQFIAASARQPFLCYLSLPTPHSPFQVPDAYFDRAKKRGLDDRLACIYGMCENIDDNIARVLHQLADLNLLDNTIVIFLTDNGPNGQRFNAGMRGVKGNLHEGGSRVPFFLRWPARFKEPRGIETIAAHIDVLPTLVDLCGLPQPKTLPLDGRSLAPLLEGRTAHWPDRLLFTQHQLLAKEKPLSGAVRTQRYRLVGLGGKWQLFDMDRDPGQEHDVAAQHPELTRNLTAAFAKWYAEVRAEADRPRPPIPVGHAEENPVELPVPQSRFSGGLRFNGKHPNNAWLVGWTNLTAKTAWEVEVVRGGLYEVTLRYLCPQSQAGSRLRIEAGESRCEVVVPATPLRKVPSPDRVPRDEVYEMEWATLPAGTLQLSPGRTQLVVQPLTIANQEAMELKAVILRRR